MKRILIDPAKCDGCKNCSVACMSAHSKEPSDLYTIDLLNPENESRNSIHKNAAGGYLPLFCRHCDAPECVAACMSGALEKNPETGIVEYDKDKCGACFMCVMNCPFGLPKPDKMTRSAVVKCDFCKDSGGEPSCIKACPTKALFLQEVQA